MSELDETIKAYSRNVENYLRIEHAVPEENLRKFVNSLDNRVKHEPWSNSKPRVLDAGCGAGRDLEFFRYNLSVDAHGVDISPEMTAFAFERATVPCLPGDIRKLKNRDGEFDAVWCYEVLQHFHAAEIVAALKEFYRVTRNNGFFYVGMPVGEDERIVETTKVNGDTLVKTSILHPISTIEALIGETGFRLLETPEPYKAGGQNFANFWFDKQEYQPKIKKDIDSLIGMIGLKT